MESRTKKGWSHMQIVSLLPEPWNAQSISGISELSDGYYNESYRVDFSRAPSIVLKIGPVAGIEVLSYEERMMETEIAVLNRYSDFAIPMPRLLYFDTSCSRIPAPFSITECLSGTPLNKLDLPLEKKRPVYLSIAHTLAKMHRVKGDHFGYPLWKQNLKRKNYSESFRYMVSKVISDGLMKGTKLPVKSDLIFKLIDSRKHAFEVEGDPCLVHFDLWEGNIFVLENEGKLVLEAVIDFERSFYADPAVDMTQVDLVFDLHEESWFLDEYNRFAEVPVYWDEKTRTRVCLFKLYLFLIMIVESDYRDLEGSFIDQRKWSIEQFLKVYQQLIEY